MLIQFPSSAAPNTSTGVRRITGQCVAHAIFISDNHYMDCYSNATATIYGEGCECERGYEKIGNSCKACSFGYFKSSPGNQACVRCGNNTVSASGASSCTCNNDHYRPITTEDNNSTDCHTIPSAPQNLAKLEVKNTTLILIWTQPSKLGTMPDIWYAITCDNADAICSGIRYVPGKDKIVPRCVQLSNLKSYSRYQFTVYSENGATTAAGKKHAVRINLRTQPGLPTVVTNIKAHRLGYSLSITWAPPQFKGDKTVGYEIQCDGYAAQQLFYPIAVFKVKQSGLLLCKIRVNNSVGESPWVSRMFRLDLSSNTENQKEDTVVSVKTILFVSMSIVAIGIIFVLILIVWIRRRNRMTRPELVPVNTPPSPINDPYVLVPISIPGPGTAPGTDGMDEEDAQYIDMDLFEYAIDDLGEQIQVLGEGQFGIVYLATAKNISGNTGISKVAVKMLKAETARERDVKDFQNELKIMKKLRAHPHIVRLLGCCTVADPQCIILEFLPNGNLLDLLRKSRGYNGSSLEALHSTKLSSKQLLEFALMIADGMHHLSSQKVVHRDLACRNILVSRRLDCKISDLGLARELDKNGIHKREQNATLPVKWMAYESLFDGISTTKSDVWSFGIALYEILTIGNIPYPEHKSKQIFDLISQGYRMEKPAHCSDELYRIMSKCWEKQPSYRPSFDGLKNSLKQLLDQNDHVYLNLDKYNDELYVQFEADDDDTQL